MLEHLSSNASATRVRKSAARSDKQRVDSCGEVEQCSTAQTLLLTKKMDDAASVKTGKSSRSIRSIFSFRSGRAKSNVDSVPPPPVPRLPKYTSAPGEAPPTSPGAKGRRLQKKSVPPSYEELERQQAESLLPPQKQWRGFGVAPEGIIDSQTGERKDITEMLHSMAFKDEDDEIGLQVRLLDPHRKRGESDVAKLPSAVWRHLAGFLDASTTASLAFASKTLLERLGREPWMELNRPDNEEQRLYFLNKMDAVLPDYLLCHVCQRFHLRTKKGAEKLQPTLVLNPIFDCPQQTNVHAPPARTRIVPRRTLPFTFVQLALRAAQHGPEYGITLDSLARRWKDPESGWSYQTRYQIHNGHLLMRVISSVYAAPQLTETAERMLLYSREDYWPYFSACTHWRDGELMPATKCALKHIPGPPKHPHREQVWKHMQQWPAPEVKFVSLCGFCQPMRRCPECPSEYLIELRLAEDKAELDPKKRFKQQLTVTRWCDLGNGSSPNSPEWSSIQGKTEYESFTTIGRRAVSGIFESKTADTTIPGQRIISMNPKKETKGEDGDGWY